MSHNMFCQGCYEAKRWHKTFYGTLKVAAYTSFRWPTHGSANKEWAYTYL